MKPIWPSDDHLRATYTGFDRLSIGSEWWQGKVRALKNHDPYTGKVILEIPQGDRSNLDDAYEAATRAHDA